MSTRFTIEIPKSRMSWESMLTVAAGVMFMVGPLITMVNLIGGTKMPVAMTVTLVLSFVFGVVCGFLFIRNEVRQQRSKRAEKHLKSAVKRMGYIALEPIEVHGQRDRVLLRDEHESALWDVSVSGNKVTCAKRS